MGLGVKRDLVGVLEEKGCPYLNVYGFKHCVDARSHAKWMRISDCMNEEAVGKMYAFCLYSHPPHTYGNASLKSLLTCTKDLACLPLGFVYECMAKCPDINFMEFYRDLLEAAIERGWKAGNDAFKVMCCVSRHVCGQRSTRIREFERSAGFLSRMRRFLR